MTQRSPESRVPRVDPADVGPDMSWARVSCEPVWVYAIQAGPDGPIKIGLAKKPLERLKTLQTANAAELRGIRTWRCHPSEEKFIHKEFAYARIRGEWFQPVPDLIDYVLYNGAPFEELDDYE